MSGLSVRSISLRRGLILGVAMVWCSLTAASETREVQSGTLSNSLSFGGYYSRGDYGEDTATAVTYLPVSLEHSVSDWRFRMTVPHLRISGPGNVLVNVGGVTRPDVPARDPEYQRMSPRGVGDVLVSATRELPALADWMPFVDLEVEIKLPTAGPGLGTGATDVGLQADVFQLVGVNTVFGTVGYRFRGDSRWFEGLQNSLYLSLGAMRPLPLAGGQGTWSWGLIYDYRQAASALSRETHELLPFLSWAPAPAWSFLIYSTRGFTRDSPDYALGVQLSHRW